MALATQLQVEKFLQVDYTNDPDAAITMLLENATGLIHSYIDRYLPETAYTETYDAPQGSVLHLDHYPVAVAPAPTVTEDGTLLTVDTEYRVDHKRGRIIRTSGSGSLPRDWRNKLQTIAMTYTAGYDFTVDPLLESEAVVARDTCTRIVARVFQAAAAYASVPASSALIKSVTLIGSDTITYRDTETGGVTTAAIQLTDADKIALDPLRRKVLISG